MHLATGTTVQLKSASQLVKERRIDFRRAQKAANAGTSVSSSKKHHLTATKKLSSTIVATEDIQSLVSWKQPKKIGPGLMNLGNTCYLNSVLQCLAYSPAFAQYLIPRAKHGDAKGNGFHGEKVMARLLGQMHASTAPRVMQPREIVVNLKQIAKFFRIGRQEDSHEFFRHLMDSIHKSSLKQAGIKDNTPEASSTLVHSVFGGTLRSHVKCAKCKFVSERTEPFLDLSLEISSGISDISSALSHFTAVETLDAENAWKCSGCSQRSRASKGLNIHTVPNGLVLHLKRFDSFYGKLKKHIAFDEILNLNHGKILTKPIADATYMLTAVLVHSGSSPDCGHYYAFVKSPAGTWHEMNDETVRIVNISTVLQQRAYMLFYTRKLPKTAPKPKSPEPVVPAVKPISLDESIRVVRKDVTPTRPVDDDGETSQESLSEASIVEEEETLTRSKSKSTNPSILQGFAPVFIGHLNRSIRFRTSWKRYRIPINVNSMEETPQTPRVPVIRAGFRPHMKFQNSLLTADVPQWRDDDQDMPIDIQKQHNQKVRQLNSDEWQDKKRKQLDYWDQTLDQGKTKKVKEKKHFISNEGKANQFQRLSEAKKLKKF